MLYLWNERKAKNVGELWSMKTNNVGTVPRRLMVISIKNLRFMVILFVLIASAQAIEVTKFFLLNSLLSVLNKYLNNIM